MAVDLTCFSSMPMEDVEAIVDSLVASHRGLFYSASSSHRTRFLVSKVAEASEIDKEIALEYGLVANCWFMVSLNDKSAADLVATAISIIKNALGVGNVIILSDGETLR